MCKSPFNSIHWANIRPTSTENDSGTRNSSDRFVRSRRRDKLASLKLENNELKSKLNSVEAKLKAAEKEIDELKWYKRIAYISIACCLILLIVFAVWTNYCKSGPQNICDFRIIPREEWADKELKANTSDLEPLPLPVPGGVIALHTGVPDNSCFSYGEFQIQLIVPVIDIIQRSALKN